MDPIAECATAVAPAAYCGRRQRLPGIRYRFDSLTRYQPDSNTSGMITLLWNVAVPGQGTKTGIDLLRHEGARITGAWSITGDLELPFMR